MATVEEQVVISHKYNSKLVFGRYLVLLFPKNDLFGHKTIIFEHFWELYLVK